jgi:hypothetical protein
VNHSSQRPNTEVSHGGETGRLFNRSYSSAFPPIERPTENVSVSVIALNHVLLRRSNVVLSPPEERYRIKLPVGIQDDSGM